MTTLQGAKSNGHGLRRCRAVNPLLPHENKLEILQFASSSVKYISHRTEYEFKAMYNQVHID